MGAKGVKVIVLDDTGMTMRAPKDPEKFKEANKYLGQVFKKHPVTGQGLPAYGTNVLTNVLNEAGGYPTYNFKQGRFDGGRQDQRRNPGRTGNSAAEGRPPTAAIGAVSSAVREPIMTRTAII